MVESDGIRRFRPSKRTNQTKEWNLVNGIRHSNSIGFHQILRTKRPLRDLHLSCVFMLFDNFCGSDVEFRNTGLERAENLAKDLEWFKEQGHSVPEPSTPGVNYSLYIEELSKEDPQSFICHFYNTYFAHTAGGRMIGKKVAAKILNNKELEFYKWDGDLSQLLQNVREKLNGVAENWTRDEKNHCLEETEKSFKFNGDILRLMLT